MVAGNSTAVCVLAPEVASPVDEPAEDEGIDQYYDVSYRADDVPERRI